MEVEVEVRLWQTVAAADVPTLDVGIGIGICDVVLVVVVEDCFDAVGGADSDFACAGSTVLGLGSCSGNAGWAKTCAAGCSWCWYWDWDWDW